MGRPRSCSDTTPPPDASTTFAPPANDDPTRSYRPDTGRCRLGRAEQSRFIWRPSTRTGLLVHWRPTGSGATRAAKSLPGTRHRRRCGVGAESRRAGSILIVDTAHRRPRT